MLSPSLSFCLADELSKVLDSEDEITEWSSTNVCTQNNESRARLMPRDSLQCIESELVAILRRDEGSFDTKAKNRSQVSFEAAGSEPHEEWFSTFSDIELSSITQSAEENGTPVDLMDIGVSEIFPLSSIAVASEKVERGLPACSGIVPDSVADRNCKWEQLRNKFEQKIKCVERKSVKRRASSILSHDTASRPSYRSKKLPEVAVRVLKEWLMTHLSNPYPEEDDKDELSIQTGLRISQINNWFINARRRHLPHLKSH